MRVVVTGGAGFVGSHLCTRLVSEGHEVVCLDNFVTGSPANVRHLFSQPAFELRRQDVSEQVSVGGPVDAVLHFASPASPIDYQRLPLQTLKAGGLGTMHALDLARANNARFVLASTSEVYGDPLVHPQAESYWGHVNPIGPRSMYDEAKRYAEAMTTAYRQTHGVATGIVRIFNTYGPRMRSYDGRAVPTFVGQALRGKPVTVAGDGSQTRSLCYVDDLVDGVIRMLRSDLSGPVNLGNPHEMTILDIAKLVVELSGAKVPITFVDRPPDDPAVRRPEIALARDLLGWQPAVDVRDGLARTVAWFAATSHPEPPVPASTGPLLTGPGTGPVPTGPTPTSSAPQAAGPGWRPTERVCVIGAGYLGTTHAACLAELGYEVLALDVDAARVARLAGGEVPFHEPNLGELLARHVAAGRLRFTTSFAEATAFGDVHFLCVGTPQLSGGAAADLTDLREAVERLAPGLRVGSLVVGKSTVPAGTAASLAGRLVELCGTGVELVWNPEFLREGFAVQDTLEPDRLVFGVASDVASDRMHQLYAPLIEAGTPVVVTDYATAEVVKAAANSFLATKISFVNAMAELCDAVGGDVVTLARALGYDARIGAAFLRPGIGFGGGCLPKDVRAFQARADELGVGSALGFLRQVDEINLRTRQRFVNLVTELLGGSLAGARIAALGAAFKPDTDDVRESPSLAVASAVARAGATVTVYDPVAVDNARRHHPDLQFASSTTAAAVDADAVVLLTEWPEFGALDPRTLSAVVRRRIVVDGRHALDGSTWRRAGWTYRALGRPAALVGFVPTPRTGRHLPATVDSSTLS